MTGTPAAGLHHHGRVTTGKAAPGRMVHEAGQAVAGAGAAEHPVCLRFNVRQHCHAVLAFSWPARAISSRKLMQVRTARV